MTLPPDLLDCLPSELRGPETAITKIAAGLSGAGVYRVEAAGNVYVLKIAPATESLDDWRRRVAIHRAAAAADVAPAVIHTDETRRAVVTTFIVDRSFTMYAANPAT